MRQHKIWGCVCLYFSILSGIILMINFRESRQGQIAFVASMDVTQQPRSSDIYLIDLDGKNLRNLTKHPSYYCDPAWSPDGRMIAFASHQDGNYEIYVMDSNGENLRNLTNHPAGDAEPSWSPDGERIAFFSNRDGNEPGRWDFGNIYVMKADGSDVRRLTDEFSWPDHYPAWSPDGNRIAFSSKRDGNTDIYVMDAYGENIQRLTFHDEIDDQPSWLPNGRKIAFCSWRNGVSFNTEIYVVDTNGRNLRRLTKIPSWEMALSWSPNGREIAFSSYQYGNTDIYVADTNGDRIRRITHGSMPASSPAWKPLSSRTISRR